MRYLTISKSQLIRRFAPLLLLIPGFFLTFLFVFGQVGSDATVIRIYSQEEYDSIRTVDIINENDISNDFIMSNEGKASYYSKRFHNRRTASGERFDMNAMTAAHRKLPFGTIVRVTNPQTDKVVLVRINDRGPFVRNKIIDLSKQAALEIEGGGTPFVKIEALKPSDNYLINGSSSEFLFGYSYTKPLICLPRNLLNIIDSTSSFKSALQLYNEISGYSPDIYLFASSKKPDLIKKDIERANNYYIAKIQSETQPENFIFVASKY